MKKIKVTYKGYFLVSDAVSRGVAYGYRHAHKHVEHPEEAALLNEIENSVLNELCDVINFD